MIVPVVPLRARWLIEACLADPARRAAAWGRWLDATHFDDIDPASFDVLPSVAHLNRDLALRDADRLRGVFRHNWAANQARIKAVIPVLDDLNRSHIGLLALKALALCPQVYGTFGARRFADLDVLVEAADFETTAGILRRHGFVPAAGGRWPRAALKSWAFYRADGADLDLHVRPCEEAGDAAALRLFWTASSHVDVGGLRVGAPAAAASLLMSLLHGLRFDARGNVRWIVDAGLLIQSGRVDWDHFAALGRAFRVEYALACGLAVVAPFIGGSDIPEAWRRPRAGVLERVEQRFRVRAPGGLMGALPNLYFLYIRDRRAGVWRSGFAPFLRDVWQIEADRSLALALVGKAGRRLAATRPS